ncbi:MAG TPA: alpha/beta hydrolase [Steroidobacteraceae bacterium]|nr:alpha/beta hydrolase [Steroidobacteraceae bacterium]
MARAESANRTNRLAMACTLSIALAVLALAGRVRADAAPLTAGTVRNIVLVHGALIDGSGWRGVYDILTKDGYHVSIVQEPLTGLAEDVAATQRVIDQQHGPVLLVGQSYGGTIITVAGADPRVRALVYVAALQPDVGETTNELAASMPGTVPARDLKTTRDGFVFVDPTKFAADVAFDLPRPQAEFMANSQVPVAAAAFDAPVTVAAWREKPSYGIIASEDRELNPKLARWMYTRSGAKITVIKAGHLVYISHPRAVASVIERAARSIRGNTTKPR